MSSSYCDFSAKNQLNKYALSLSNADRRSYNCYRRMKNQKYLHKEPTKSTVNKTLCSTGLTTIGDENTKTIPEKNFEKKKLSYVEFLELSNNLNNYPFNCTEKRFNWQNLKNNNYQYYADANNKKRTRKNFFEKTKFKKNFFNDFPKEKKPKHKKLFFKDSFDYSRRVIIPEFNNEPEKKHLKKKSTLSKIYRNRTNGNIQSLLLKTPSEFPVTGNKKFFKDLSFQTQCINLFSDNFGKIEMPIKGKKRFINNKCYFDNIENEDLITCNWKKIRRCKSVIPFSNTKDMKNISVDLDLLQLRNRERGGDFPMRHDRIRRCNSVYKSRNCFNNTSFGI